MDGESFLSQLFPSSRRTSYLYDLGKTESLPNGEQYNTLAITSSCFSDGDKLIRTCALIFARGHAPSDLCKFSMSAVYEDGIENGIKVITESIQTSAAPGAFERKTEHYYRESSHPESWKFPDAAAKLDALLSQTGGCQGQEIPTTHPLLNPVPIRTARLGGGGGGHQR